MEGQIEAIVMRQVEEGLMEGKNLIRTHLTREEVVQGFIFTVLRGNYTTYERRIVYALLDIVQAQIKGLELRNNLTRIDHDLFKYAYVTIPFSSVMVENDRSNHYHIRKSLRNLIRKVFEIENKKTWMAFTFFTKVIMDKYDNTFTLVMTPEVWGYMLDFTKGYRKFELKMAMKLNSIYAMRFYELVSRTDTPICYPVYELKKMFAIEDKYERINDFEKYVLKIAKQELDSCSPYTFNYKPIKIGRKIVSFLITPIHQPKYENQEIVKKRLQHRITLGRGGHDFFKQERFYLREILKFSNTEIKNNIDTFTALKKYYPDILPILEKIKMKADQNRGEIKNFKGYIIASLKQELQTKFDERQGKLFDFSDVENPKSSNPENPANRITKNLVNKFSVR